MSPGARRCFHWFRWFRWFRFFRWFRCFDCFLERTGDGVLLRDLPDGSVRADLDADRAVEEEDLAALDCALQSPKYEVILEIPPCEGPRARRAGVPLGGA